MKAAEREPSRTHRGACAIALATCALAFSAPAAPADVVFGIPPGPGAGQTDNPEAIAIDREAGLLYVADGGNNRVDVFKADGSFLRAFGWGVADGTTAALQTCTTTCFKGLSGGGAGEFSDASSIAVDNDPASPAHHDVYVADGSRVQRFSTDDNGTPANPADDFAVFERAWGGGVISAGASGIGDLTSGSTTIANVTTTAKRFLLGQTITAPGKIPAGTRIVGFGAGTIVLSQPASGSGTGVALSAPVGAGHVAVNEVHEIVLSGLSGGSYTFRFETPNPSPTQSTTKSFAFVPGVPAATIQAQIEELSNIDPGDVAVSGPAGGPYTVEFKGRYADTDVIQLDGSSTALTKETTVKNGASSAAICTAADCTAGVRGDGPGQFTGRLQVAIGPGGAVHVGDDGSDISGRGGPGTEPPRLQAFDPAGALTGVLAGISAFAGLAVEPDGDFYATDAFKVAKYDPSGTLLDTIDPVPSSIDIRAIALDPAGDLFIAERGEAETAVYEYDSAGNPIHTYYGNETLKAPPGSLAAYSDATGDLFVLEESSPRRLAHIAIEPPGPVVLPFAAPAGPSQESSSFDTRATNVSNLTATLNTRVNPEGKSSTVHFQYVDDASFKAEGGFASSKTVTTPESTPIGADFTHHAASFTIPCAGPGEPGCLAADTVYHFRAVATNADGVDAGPEATFKTLPPITLGTLWATAIGTDSAVLHAELNPNGIAAKVHFEYVDDATFQASGFATAQKTASVDFGAGTAELSKSALAHPLAPDTLYHYRYVAEDFFGAFTGPEATFATFPPPAPPREDCPNRTFRTGASANLPDCRAYELVSPLEKGNGDILAFKELAGMALGQTFARVDQATPDGDGLAYGSYVAFGDAQSAPWGSQYVARRDPAAGWSTRSVNPPREGPNLYSGADLDGAYSGFSEDLCSGWFLQKVDLALVPGAPPGVPNLYRRRSCGAEAHELLTTVPPPGFGLETGETASLYSPEVRGFSADGALTAFVANAKLTPDASEEDVFQTYLHREGELRLLSVLPSGNAAKTHSTVGSVANRGRFFGNVRGAVSADASRIFWSAGIVEGGGAGAPSRLYLRVNPTQAQSKLSKGKCTEAAKACTVQISEGAATFRAADPQASRVLYTEGEDLYELDVAKAIAYQAGAASLIAHGIKGLLGASEDASRIYFVSSEDLDGAGPAAAGKFNLYLHESGGGFTFVATLLDTGWQSNSNPKPGEEGASSDVRSISPYPVNHSSRVSADGLHAAFMSDSLALAEETAGYDNTDANSGKADSEVYLYDAEEGELRCVSCNPSGALPAGRSLVITNKEEAWTAARIPGWETQFQASRPLSADGRHLFFESFEALVPRDTNGKNDVYQWEQAASKEECLQGIGGELFAPKSDGCLSLISSGKGIEHAEFLDASETGSDVFFTTDASLLSHDYGLIDIYDARVGGGFPPPPGPPGACEGEACQIAPPPPNDPTPASAGLKGAGNLRQSPRRLCAKGKVRRKGRCVKRRAKKQRHRSKRANHKRRAGR